MATVFLDIDGVLSDTEQLSADYDSLIGDVLAPVLGGSPSDWGTANRSVFPSVSEYLRSLPRPVEAIAGFDEESRLLIAAMCQHLDLPAPDAETAADLGRRITVHVRRNGDAALTEAAPAIEELAASRGVHLATGNGSWGAIAVLERIGVREAIGLPSGADLVGVLKGPLVFYERLFALAAVSPAEAIVVDDLPEQLGHAASLGARTILVSPEGQRRGDLPTDALVVESISEVPGAVASTEASMAHS